MVPAFDRAFIQSKRSNMQVSYNAYIFIITRKEWSMRQVKFVDYKLGVIAYAIVLGNLSTL